MKIVFISYIYIYIKSNLSNTFGVIAYFIIIKKIQRISYMRPIWDQHNKAYVYNTYYGHIQI